MAKKILLESNQIGKKSLLKLQAYRGIQFYILRELFRNTCYPVNPEN
jgi:hypothetical protein